MEVYEKPRKSPTRLEEKPILTTDDVDQEAESATQTAFQDESDREDHHSSSEHKVHFKEQLVDLEVPPESPRSSSSSSSDDEPDTKEVTTGIGDLNIDPSKKDDTVEISGQFLRRDEKVLVEIGGRFHVVEAGEIEKNLPMMEESFQAENRVTLPPVKPRHPRSAPIRSSQPTPPVRSASATPDYYKVKQTPTFSYSEEMKKLIRRQTDLKAKRESEESAKRKKEEEMARLEADEAWKAWVGRKQEEIRKKKKRDEQERKRMDRQKWKDPEEIEEAYSAWMKQKMTQIKKERIVVQQQQIEYDEGWYLRERRDCNKAFRVWLRNKSEMTRKAKENESKVRKRSIREMRRARKEQKLMEKIREAQQMKYVDYYGYRI